MRPCERLTPRQSRGAFTPRPALGREIVSGNFAASDFGYFGNQRPRGPVYVAANTANGDAIDSACCRHLIVAQPVPAHPIGKLHAEVCTLAAHSPQQKMYAVTHGRG